MQGLGTITTIIKFNYINTSIDNVNSRKNIFQQKKYSKIHKVFKEQRFFWGSILVNYSIENVHK